MTQSNEYIVRVYERIPKKEVIQARLELVWDQRQKTRFRSTLEDGREVAVILPREGGLRGGDCLRSDSGLVIGVVAAPEDLMEARCEDSLLFARATYHMGNRHVPLEIRGECMRFKPDHVLEEMLNGLGMEVSRCRSAFDPENGAYGNHAHGHPDHNHGAPGNDSEPAKGPRIHLMHDDAKSDEPA